MVGWHRPLNGHEFEQALGDGVGQFSRKESDATEQLNNNNNPYTRMFISPICL